MWEPYDPGALLGAGIAKLGSKALGLDEIASDLAREKMQRGVALARTSGFDARGQIAQGKPWQAICQAAEELDASTIVLGARGLSRIQSALLGGVSAAVLVHANRPVLVVPPVTRQLMSARHPRLRRLSDEPDAGNRSRPDRMATSPSAHHPASESWAARPRRDIHRPDPDKCPLDVLALEQLVQPDRGAVDGWSVAPVAYRREAWPRAVPSR